MKGTMGSYYACSDYVSINPEFGTLQDFKKLVKTAHSQGFKVIIDWVANHTGWDHKWSFEQPDYYVQNERGEFYDKHGGSAIMSGQKKIRNGMRGSRMVFLKEHPGWMILSSWILLTQT